MALCLAAVWVRGRSCVLLQKRGMPEGAVKADGLIQGVAWTFVRGGLPVWRAAGLSQNRQGGRSGFQLLHLTAQLLGESGPTPTNSPPRTALSDKLPSRSARVSFYLPQIGPKGQQHGRGHLGLSKVALTALQQSP